MRAIWALGMGLLVSMSAAAQECAVAVILDNPALANQAVLAKAKAVATAIFAGIGVDLHWAGKAPVDASRCSVPVEVRLVAVAGPGESPYSLAASTVGSGAVKRIQIFMDRVTAMVPDVALGTLLGHVLAHEIAHIVEGVPRHSSAGVMKSRWERKDLQSLVYRPLRFALVDDALIHAALIQSNVANEAIGANE